MPTFDCLNSRPRHLPKGFTLIETLVVLLIITVLAGVTIARLPAFARDADTGTEKRRLELLFSMAQQEAILDSTEYGFMLTDKGYKFLRYDDGLQGWKDAAKPFHERTLPDEINLRLRTDDKRGFGLLGENLPPVLILSSGESTPFQLALTSSGRDLIQTLRSDGYGEFTWEAP